MVKRSPMYRKVVKVTRGESVSVRARTATFSFYTYFHLSCGHVRRVAGHRQEPPASGELLCGKCRQAKKAEAQP